MVFINLFLVSFLISVLITVPAAKALALYLNIVDIPDGNLKKHQKTTPYLGGLAIFVSLWLVIISLYQLDYVLTGLFLGTLVILLVGLIDDLLALSPIQKLLGQVVSAIFLVTYGFYLNLNLPFSLSKMVSFFWIVALMNAFNLVDVMDGLATVIGICATSSLMFYAAFLGQQDLYIFLTIFLGAQVAFFCYNRPNAVMYLGDAGSMLIGAFLAAISLKLKWGNLPNNSLNLLIAPIILSIPLVEVCCLILIRKFKHIPFYNGSPDHFKHYLKNKGWGEWQILWYVATHATLLALLSWLVAFSGFSITLLLLVGIVLWATWFCVVFMKTGTFRS